jgi:hypothetical protein
MKEITSKKTGKVQIISEETWKNIVSRGWAKKFIAVDIPPRVLKAPMIIKPKEIKIKKDGKKD